jgi:MFS family permease
MEAHAMTTPSSSPAKPPAGGDASRAAWWGLAVLIALGLVTYMDRQVIGLQAEPIRRQLGLDDTQFAMIQGLSVALLTVLAGYPIGWLADRFDRRHVLAACLLTWCAAVALCGAATSFQGLFLASGLVGAAEAGLLPIAYALIPDWFAGRARQAANSSFVLLGRLGVGAVIVVCGWLIHAIDAWRPVLPAAWQGLPTWRLALFATALTGLLLLPLVLILPRVRPAGAAAAAAAPGHAVGTAALPLLRARAAVFVPFYLGAGLLAFGASAIGTFVPVAAARAFAATPLAAGQGLGAAALAGALVALAATVALTRRVPLTHRPDAALHRATWAMGCAAATAPALLLAGSAGAFFALYGLHLACVMTAVVLLPTALQALSPPPLRARLMSIFVSAAVVLGAGGPLTVGALSDAAHGTARALMLAMVVVAATAHAMAAVLLRVCARRCR